ncbi:MAG: glutamine-hydrolyzing carbamoyl-phosphate synthase small subunit [Thermoanaerobaculia bacterium]|nr:glutamine-hydrolyzing carbamoyl-phosphate synthase small subunit [Thermoanaerobaculia bacterium]MBP9824482.1 glutamine-hydrolyzing carbamoyl-phosphate synthase small subunit [Thermoanaerobaculia bacterium]
MTPIRPALLVLEDGSVHEGRAVARGTRFGEVVFNTAMSGYQEVLTDPSYRGQIVVMTQPHIGNYGMNPGNAESERIWVEGFIARQFTAVPSNFASEGGLVADLQKSGVPALDGIDTRALVRKLRERGALRGVLTTERSDVAALVAEVREFPVMTGRALVDEVTCSAAYELPVDAGVEELCHLAVLDFGIKRNILRSLSARGARLTVLPARTPAADVLALDVDGIVLSNGPGDPEPLVDVIAAVRELADSGLPTFGICLGHQLLGLAMGGRTFKLKFGHHGGNQPVVDLATRAVTITSQNHGFAVDPDSLPRGCVATEINLNDGTVEAFAVTGRPILSVQYHPEAAPGPHDASPLFGRFLDLVAARAHGARTARV